MDPHVALRTIRSHNHTLAERINALAALSNWINMGGFVPGNVSLARLIEASIAITIVGEHVEFPDAEARRDVLRQLINLI